MEADDSDVNLSLCRCPWLTKVISPAVPLYNGLVFLFVLANFSLATFMDPGVYPRGRSAVPVFNFLRSLRPSQASPPPPSLEVLQAPAQARSRSFLLSVSPSSSSDWITRPQECWWRDFIVNSCCPAPFRRPAGWEGVASGVQDYVFDCVRQWSKIKTRCGWAADSHLLGTSWKKKMKEEQKERVWPWRRVFFPTVSLMCPPSSLWAHPGMENFWTLQFEVTSLVSQAGRPSSWFLSRNTHKLNDDDSLSF